MDNTKLEMVFLNQMGTTSKLVVDGPRQDLVEADVQLAMNNIIAQNVFSSPGGDLTQISSAQIVTTSVNELIAAE